MEFGFSDSTDIQIWTPYGSVTVNYPFANNTWHYILAVGGNGQISLYLDGVLAGTSAASGSNFGESDFDFNIGGGGVFDPTGNYFKGQIDEVAVWFRALATNEITALLATNAEQVSYTNYIATDVRSQMYGSNATACVRIPFTVADPAALDNLQLLMRFDDGFAAYLNGHLIAASNAPASLAWNSAATQRHPDPQAVQWTAFDVSAARQWLQPGNNVLAVQALNIAATNTDFLMQAQLASQNITDTAIGWRYFTGATPGAPNGTGTNDFGPVMSGASHSPNVPAAGAALAVTAQVVPGFNAISNVLLHYRVMFNAETNSDDEPGQHQRHWTGTIPGGVATAGQLLRYYVTAMDVSNNISRWPIFPSATESQQYFGTVVADPSVQSQLPVAYLFVQDTASADNQTGTQGSLFYLNELYDNLNIYVHGQTSVGWPKKSHNLDFPKDHQFLYQPGGIREKKVIFISNYGDKARMCTTLTYAASTMSGGMSLFSFPIRIQLNNTFFGIEDMVEHGDDNWLDRIGRDGNGALYKMYNSLTSASGNEKKTREWEGTDDLTALINSLDESLPLTNRVTYAWDNLDLPQTASYFADMAVASSQDVSAKNYYLYRDSDSTGEWAITPWDVDLTWGRNWIDAYGYFTDTLYTNNVLSFDNPAQQYKPANRLFDLFFANADFRQMYLRRLRTLMDSILMPPGTPTNALVIEPLIRQYESRLNPPAISPSDTALDYAAWGPTWGDTSLSQFPNFAEQIVSNYLPGRRNFLYSTNAVLNGDFIPAAQPTNAVADQLVDYNPASGNAAEQYVELRNTNACSVDVSNWRLIGAVEFTLRPGTVIPAGKSLYLAANVNAFRARAASPHAGTKHFRARAVRRIFKHAGQLALDFGKRQRRARQPEQLRRKFLGRGVHRRQPRRAAHRRWHGLTWSVQATRFSLTSSPPTARLRAASPFPTMPPTRCRQRQRLVRRRVDPLGGRTAARHRRLQHRADEQRLVARQFQRDQCSPRARRGGRARQLRAGRRDDESIQREQHAFRHERRTRKLLGRGRDERNILFWRRPDQHGANQRRQFHRHPGHRRESLFQHAENHERHLENSRHAHGARHQRRRVFERRPKASTYGFALNAAATTAYLADDTLKGIGGIQRWDFNGTAWMMSYAFTSLTNVGARGVAVDFSGAQPVIYATTAENSTNRLVSITDTGAKSAATTLATAGVNQIFRGVALAPDAGLAPQFFSASGDAMGFALSWTALLSRNYTVQYNGDLSTTNWLTLTNLTTTAPEITVFDPAGRAPAGSTACC